MTKYLTRLDDQLLEVHFGRDTIVTQRFAVTMAGWHNVWLMTQYDGAYAKADRIMLKSEAIVWSRYKDILTWAEIDHENLIPIEMAHKDQALKVTNHITHSQFSPHGDDDTCSVSARQIEGYGWVYKIEEEEDGSLLPEMR